MKNVTKNQLVEILKDSKLEDQVKHFYLHNYIKNHKDVSFSEGIINWNPKTWGIIPRDKRDKYTLVSYKGDITYIFMSEMNVSKDGYLYFTNSVQNKVPNGIYLTNINNDFISIIDDLL